MRELREGGVQIVDLDKEAASSKHWYRDFAAIHWSAVLVWLMRAYAGIWMAKGLLNWAVIIGATERFGEFGTMPRTQQGVVVFHAAADLVAAAGLWMAAPWGGVLWVLSAGVEIISPFLAGRSAMVGRIALIVDASLVLAYFVANWRAAQESE